MVISANCNKSLMNKKDDFVKARDKHLRKSVEKLYKLIHQYLQKQNNPVNGMLLVWV